MELVCGVLHGYFGPVYLLQVSKNDDENHCFLKKFGFKILPHFSEFVYEYRENNTYVLQENTPLSPSKAN